MPHTKLSDCEYPANFVFASKPATLAKSRDVMSTQTQYSQLNVYDVRRLTQ